MKKLLCLIFCIFLFIITVLAVTELNVDTTIKLPTPVKNYVDSLDCNYVLLSVTSNFSYHCNPSGFTTIPGGGFVIIYGSNVTYNTGRFDGNNNIAFDSVGNKQGESVDAYNMWNLLLLRLINL